MADDDHKTPIMAASNIDSAAMPQLTTLNSAEEDMADSPRDDEAGDALRSREASMRIASDDGEPPPIDKQTLFGLIAVYFSVFLDMMGISIVQPVLPFYAESFNADSFQLGALYSSYSLMSTFASYAMGKASDKVKFMRDRIQARKIICAVLCYSHYGLARVDL